MPNRKNRSGRRRRRNNGPSRSLTSITRVVSDTLAVMLTVAPDSKGVLAGFIPADPSSSGLNIVEYGQWSSLFSQVRLMWMTVKFIPRAVIGSGGDTGPLAIASTLAQPGSPTSENVVLDNADGVLFNWIRTTNNFGLVRHLRMSNPRPTWADVTAPNPGDNVGCPGGFIYYGSNQPPPGEGNFSFDVRIGVQFRSRA